MPGRLIGLLPVHGPIPRRTPASPRHKPAIPGSTQPTEQAAGLRSGAGRGLHQGAFRVSTKGGLAQLRTPAARLPALPTESEWYSAVCDSEIRNGSKITLRLGNQQASIQRHLLLPCHPQHQRGRDVPSPRPATLTLQRDPASLTLRVTEINVIGHPPGSSVAQSDRPLQPHRQKRRSRARNARRQKHVLSPANSTRYTTRIRKLSPGLCHDC